MALRRSKNTDDSVASNVSTSNVHSLRKLFETNFKLTNITNVFKTRNRKDRLHDLTKNDDFHHEKPGQPKRSMANNKENKLRASFNASTKLSHVSSNIIAPISDENYFGCKKDNCSCRSIYRQYDQTPKFRTCGISSTIADGQSFASRPGSNRYYRLNYEFYKTKLPDDIQTTPTSSAKFKNTKITKNDREKLANLNGKHQDVQHSFKQSDGFVNFTADSLSEGGYVRSNLDTFKKTVDFQKLDTAVFEQKNATTDYFANLHNGPNFDFKQRIPRTKSTSIREHSYPYSLKKSRVTVKTVKTRNQAKNARKKEKFEENCLTRSQTFAGYDNFAYRPCIADFKLSKYNADNEAEKTDTTKLSTISKNSNSIDFTFKIDKPNSNQNFSTQFDAKKWELENNTEDSKNTSISVTNISMHSCSSKLDDRNEKSRLTKNLKITSESKALLRKCNLKRHFSLGNLEKEDYRRNYFKLGHSLDDISDQSDSSKGNITMELDDIFNEMTLTHPYLKNYKESSGQGEEALVNLRRKKTTIRQLFTAASKFQKHLKRGIYLSCLLYHEDKILVTNDDFLPVIEVDVNFPKNIQNDFYWFFKLSFCWNHLKWLKNEMVSSQNTSMEFRIKLLQAASYMQTALSVQHLGKVYHKLLRDSDGTTVICLVNNVPIQKSVSVLNSRWVPLSKFTKRASTTYLIDSNVSKILTSSIMDQIAYQQSSYLKIPRGLYVCYLRIKSSINSFELSVPCEVPNVLPYYKIRDNPHVTTKEWNWLVKKENMRETTVAARRLKEFARKVANATKELLIQVKLPDNEISNLRLYDSGTVAISDDVSLIIIASPVETITNESQFQMSNLLFLPIPVFEINHFDAYQPNFISTYSKLSCVLEMDTDVARYQLREAFNSSEINEAKSKLARLDDIQVRLSTIWKKKRWLLDVLSFARDRSILSNDGINFILNTTLERPFQSELVCGTPTPNSRREKSKTNLVRETSRSDSNLLSSTSGMSLKVKSDSAETVSIDNLSYPAIPNCEKRHGGKCARAPVPGSAIITIYAAYDTGLDSQVHFRFHISPKTTAKEIVELFVKQTNMTTLLKGKRGPIYKDDELGDFILVSMVGSREQYLTDDFKPALRENLWKDKMLYVRRKSNGSNRLGSRSQQSYAHV